MDIHCEEERENSNYRSLCKNRRSNSTCNKIPRQKSFVFPYSPMPAPETGCSPTGAHAPPLIPSQGIRKANFHHLSFPPTYSQLGNDHLLQPLLSLCSHSNETNQISFGIHSSPFPVVAPPNTTDSLSLETLCLYLPQNQILWAHQAFFIPMEKTLPFQLNPHAFRPAPIRNKFYPESTMITTGRHSEGHLTGRIQTSHTLKGQRRQQAPMKRKCKNQFLLKKDNNRNAY